MSAIKIDTINLSIIKELRQGRKSFKKIAERLEITENTVRARVNKMMNSGLLDINGQVDIEQIPHHQLVIIGVKLKTTDMLKRARSSAG
ncbi:MAG: AsnC family transcriptional regulator [Desulfovermiculus sp.]